jgi:hypothetical protein
MRISMKPTNILSYLADGRFLSLPIARGNSTKPPRSKRWIPVVFSREPASITTNTKDLKVVEKEVTYL